MMIVTSTPLRRSGAAKLSPKGWHKSAQGNALGNEDRKLSQALNGRYSLLLRRRLLRPFRASKLVSAFDSQGVALG
jgi:hypothetical protein